MLEPAAGSEDPENLMCGKRVRKRQRKDAEKTVSHAITGHGASSSKQSDTKARLERSRQSARECRARKKLRYQYLEDLVSKQEHAITTLQQEISQHSTLCRLVDQAEVSEDDVSNIFAP